MKTKIIFRYCKFHRVGKCRFGSDCKFIHDRSVVITCPWYAKGECAHGSKCDYAHISVKELHEFKNYKSIMEEKIQEMEERIEKLERTQELEKKTKINLACTENSEHPLGKKCRTEYTKDDQ